MLKCESRFPPKQVSHMDAIFTQIMKEEFFLNFTFHICILFGKTTTQKSKKGLTLYKVLVAPLVTYRNFL